MALPSAPFDPAQSIFNGLSVIQLKLTPPLSGATGATDTITKTAHGFVVGQGVVFVSGTGFTGLTGGNTYYVVAVPTADTFKVSATVGGSAITGYSAATVGVFQPVLVFEATQLDDDPEQEMKYLARPGMDGVVRNVRAVRTKANDKFTFGLEEVKRLLPIFGGALHGYRKGTATLWVPDVDDASGKCALKSPVDFDCAVSRDGKMTHGNSDFSKTSIKLESLEGAPLIWTPDAAT